MQLSSDELDILRDIIQWWQNKAVVDDPKFDLSNDKVVSARMPLDMFKEAEQQAKTIPNIRTVSRLINILIWEWLGRPDKYVVQKDGEK